MDILEEKFSRSLCTKAAGLQNAKKLTFRKYGCMQWQIHIYSKGEFSQLKRDEVSQPPVLRVSN